MNCAKIGATVRARPTRKMAVDVGRIFDLAIVLRCDVIVSVIYQLHRN